MFWRYLGLTLLLVSPGSRILISATYEVSEQDLEGGHRLKAHEKDDDDLIQRIVSQLVAAGHTHTGKIQPAQEPDKRDDIDSLVSNANTNPSSNSNTYSSSNTDKQQQQQQHEKPAGPTQGEDGAKGDNSHVVHQAGQTAALTQHHTQVENKGSKVIPTDDKRFLFTMAAVLCFGFAGLMMAGVCYYKFRRSAKAASDVEYPAYGVTGPMKERVPSPGDRKLAQSAQMYHYQHQKQQMIAMEKANGDMKHDASDDESEEDNVEGDYTVYECPGLAPTGEMEVKNPLFRGTDTPQAPPPTDSQGGQPEPPRE
ncbi:hypothetical protein EGW08_005036 [Elysia chlorotica]|uniref:Neural proliferation differentiation and control protein 1 n=1 Tax=Elysia chlorotica TaxID=188477 RepID=A0A433U056_ELYCH|nr:hypothetical protein EGW08_005036 [Elysia chlorotica]